MCVLIVECVNWKIASNHGRTHQRSELSRVWVWVMNGSHSVNAAIMCMFAPFVFCLVKKFERLASYDIGARIGNPPRKFLPAPIVSPVHFALSNPWRSTNDLWKRLFASKTESALRNVLVHPHDRHLLGMLWNDLLAQFFHNFELRSTPKIFNCIADVLQWLAKQHSIS